MSVHSKFDNPQPASITLPPIVLRFQGLHPDNLGQFDMHDHRKGGDLSHVDLDASELNEILHSEPKWQETIRAEIAAAKRKNFHERQEALRKKSRKAELAALIVEGESDPWPRCLGDGPLREGVLTVNKDWFGGTGQAEWDPAKVALFKKTAMEFLRKHFPNGQLRYANAHPDEVAFHIHFVTAVWTEKVTANRGRQMLMQASTNPLLNDYEKAQDLAGEAFAPLGIARGERRAEARRVAKAAGAEIPQKRRHIPPSEWRANQQAAEHEKAVEIINEAQSKAKVMIDEGRIAGEVAIRKSRKRAIKEARHRNEAATRKVAATERYRKKKERAAEAARRDRADAEATLDIINDSAANIVHTAQVATERLQQVKAETGVESWKLQKVRTDVGEAEKTLGEVLAEVAEVSTKRAKVAKEVGAQRQELDRLRVLTQNEGEVLTQTSEQVQALKAARQAEEQALGEETIKREEVAAELADLEGRVVKAAAKLSKTEALMKALVEGIDMLGNAVLRWISAPKPSQEKLDWGPNAPKAQDERSLIVKRIQPVMPKLAPLARAITRTNEAILSKERQEIAADATYVLDLRENWEAGKQAESTRIFNANSDANPASDGPDK